MSKSKNVVTNQKHSFYYHGEEMCLNPPPFPRKKSYPLKNWNLESSPPSTLKSEHWKLVIESSYAPTLSRYLTYQNQNQNQVNQKKANVIKAQQAKLIKKSKVL